jgi:hypothetical protein
MLNRMARARQTATATNDLQIGNLPPRQTKATELVLAEDSTDSLFENISVRLEEQLIEPTLQLSWMCLWQFFDDFSSPEVVQILGPDRANILQQLTAEERFFLMSNNVKFRVRGLRNLLSKVRDFQKISTVLQTIGTSPLLAVAFNERFDLRRVLEKMLRAINLDPTELEHRPGEDPPIPQHLLLAFATQGAGAGSPPVGAPETGDAESGFAGNQPGLAGQGGFG